MKRKLLSALIVVLVTTTIITGCGGGDKTINVSITMENARDVGSLQMELIYDATILQATEVITEELGKNAIIEFNLDKPGLIVIGIVDSSGISGSGSVASVSFNVLDNEGESPLNILNTQAHNANTLVDLLVNTEEGSFTAGKIIAPLLNFQ